MVIGAISILSIVATEFTYVAQVNQKLAFDGLDQLKAHYLAKSGLKLALLRLKAYLQIKNYVQGMIKAAGGGAAAQGMVPTKLIDMVWSQPLSFPIPDNIPGMTPADKERVEAFNKASSFDGKFTMMIESESSKFNLNMILAGYAAPQPSPSPSPSPTPGANGNSPNTPVGGNPSPNPSATPSFNPEAARDQLKTFLGDMLQNKMEEDAQFNDAYRDPHLLEDLMDNIVGWADFSYTRKTDTGDLPMKKAPFYYVSELHMIPGMDDDLYNLWAPNLTVARTPGINVNSIKDVTLKAFFPQATKEEIEQFFKDRDSEETDGTFKTEDDFYKYIQGHFQAYSRGTAFDDLKKQLSQNNIHFVSDESEFKITVNSHAGQSSRVIEAWVTLTAGTPTPGPSGAPTNPVAGNPVASAPVPTPSGAPDPGVKIHFMRVL